MENSAIRRVSHAISVRQKRWRTELVSLTVSGLDECDIQSSGMAEGQKCLVEVRNAIRDGAAVSAAAGC